MKLVLLVVQEIRSLLLILDCVLDSTSFRVKSVILVTMVLRDPLDRKDRKVTEETLVTSEKKEPKDPEDPRDQQEQLVPQDHSYVL